MGLTIDAGTVTGWGSVAEKGGEIVSKGAVRSNPVGVLLAGIFTPSKLGDGTIQGEWNRRMESAVKDIEDSRSKISQDEKDDALAAGKATAKSLEKSCAASNKTCGKQQHNGRIQAQNGTRMIVTATEAGSVWTNHPYPPPLILCKQYATNMRIAMLRIQGHSKPDTKIKNPIDYHNGATKAYLIQTKWMEEKTPYGVTVGKHSFSFSGKHFLGVVPPDSDCRRIDLDVLKGEILKG